VEVASFRTRHLRARWSCILYSSGQEEDKQNAQDGRADYAVRDPLRSARRVIITATVSIMMDFFSPSLRFLECVKNYAHTGSSHRLLSGSAVYQLGPL